MIYESKLLIACGDFFMRCIKKRPARNPLFLLSTKGHVCVGCALVNARTTPLRHYQPFVAKKGGLE
ncbi:MAG: hypothetical protein IKI88_05290 [Anaerotignum sp.]|nr:hypothetical protein [Anaerotignum sp.]